MKKILISLMFIFSSLAIAEYGQGEVCDNIQWTTSDGETTSIYEQIDNGKPVMIFWGSDG